MQEDQHGGHPSRRRATLALRGGRVSFLRCIPGQLGVCEATEGGGGPQLLSGFRFPLPLSPAGYTEAGPGFAL